MINIAILSKQMNQFLDTFISKELFKENYEYKIIKIKKLNEIVDRNFEIVIIDLDDFNCPGASIAKELYFYNKEIIIIFISKDKLKRYNSYFLNVFDFIEVKDLNKILLQDIRECFKILEKEYIGLKTAGNNITLFKQKNIKYIKMVNRKIYIFTNKEERLMEKTLKDIYDKLNSYFIIVNRDSIVNLNHILSYNHRQIIVKIDETYNTFEIAHSRAKEIYLAVDKHLKKVNFFTSNNFI